MIRLSLLSMYVLLSLSFVYGQDQPDLWFEIPNNEEYIVDIDISQDGKWMLTSGKVARLWDLETGQLVKSFEGHSEWTSQVALSPNMNFILTGDARKRAQLWDVETGSMIHEVATATITDGVPHENPAGITGLVFTSNSLNYLTGDSNGTLQLWNLQGQEVRRYYKNIGWVHVLERVPNSGLILLDRGIGGEFLDYETGEIVTKFNGTTFNGSRPAISDDGKFIITRYSIADDGTIVYVWNVQERKLVKEFNLPDSFPQSLAISESGTFTLVAGNITGSSMEANNRLIIRNSSEERVKTYQTLPDEAKNKPYSEDRIVRFLPGSEKFITVNQNRVHVWNISDLTSQIIHSEIHQN